MAVTHGRIATYNRGCRCDDCREAAREYRQRYRTGPDGTTVADITDVGGGRCTGCGRVLRSGQALASHTRACPRVAS